MAFAPADELLQPLKFKTWVLKVPIHCEGCKKRVKKVLQCIDGVYITTIDPIQQKVTVIGNVKAEILIKNLLKADKRAEIWPAKDDGKHKNSKKREKNEEQKNNQKSNESVFNVENKNPTEKEMQNLGAQPTPENIICGKISATGGGGHGGKNRKKKGQKRHNKDGSLSALDPAQVPDTINLGLTRHQISPYDYVASYNVAYPTGMWGPTYLIASEPFTYAYLQPKGQSGSLDNLNIFSEENPSGCCIM